MVGLEGGAGWWLPGGWNESSGLPVPTWTQALAEGNSGRVFSRVPNTPHCAAPQCTTDLSVPSFPATATHTYVFISVSASALVSQVTEAEELLFSSLYSLSFLED